MHVVVAVAVDAAAFGPAGALVAERAGTSPDELVVVKDAVNGQVAEARAWEGCPAFLHIAGGSSEDQACRHFADVAGPSAAVVGESFADVVLVVVDCFVLSSASASVAVK